MKPTQDFKDGLLVLRDRAIFAGLGFAGGLLVSAVGLLIYIIKGAV